MTELEIQAIVRATLDAEHERNSQRADDLVIKTISTILSSFGIEEDERKEVKADFQHLRKWRKSVERVESVGWGAAITVIVTGILGALGLGIKAMLGK